LMVKTLPPCISERCKLDPNLVVNLLRTELWRLDGQPNRRNFTTYVSDSQSNDEHSWLAQLSDCPTVLVEMLNSRACRSAVMFNDELSPNECCDLVKRLAKCVFPFQCAHGRPSMVPLLRFQASQDNANDNCQTQRLQLGYDGAGSDGTSFAQAYKNWKGVHAQNENDSSGDDEIGP
jgi:DNA mismatch repair protein MLH3